MAEKLFADFRPIPTSEWEEVIHKDLKGADYQRRLVWRTIEGISVNPYYRAEDLDQIEHMGAAPGEYPFVRGTKEEAGWLVRQSYPLSKGVKEANREALDGIERGVESVAFRVDVEEIPTIEEMRVLLNAIELDKIEVNFEECRCYSAQLISRIIEVVKEKGIEADKVQASFEVDPLNSLTTRGDFCCDNYLANLKEGVEFAKEYPNIRVVTASGYSYSDAGATLVQELAFTMAAASEYMALLIKEGLTPDQVASKLKFKLAVSSNYFMEIAKFRAAKTLWSTITKEYGVKEEEWQKFVVHAVTSRWSMTIYDPYVNMLRGTSQAMSASLAGADSIEVLPFDHPFAEESQFSNRIARNSQIILKEEAYFDKVVDPAAGSYYIETLTKSIAEHAWNLFKTVEEKGGYIAALKEGFIQSEIEATANKRDLNVATRREVLVGTNQFPNFGEKIAQNLPKEFSVKSEVELVEKPIVTPIRRYRAAEAFEELRLATERSGREPKAFMLTFGNLAFCRARAQFSSNFFAVAGIEIIDNNRFETIDEGVEEAIKSGAEIVVACSSDEEYCEGVPQIAKLLGDKAILVVAGDPACRADLEAKGITNYISVRSNLLESLQEYQTQLGI